MIPKIKILFVLFVDYLATVIIHNSFLSNISDYSTAGFDPLVSGLLLRGWVYFLYVRNLSVKSFWAWIFVGVSLLSIFAWTCYMAITDALSGGYLLLVIARLVVLGVFTREIILERKKGDENKK